MLGALQVADNVNKVLAFFFAGTPLAESFEASRRNQNALAPIASPAKLLESVQDILPVLPSLATQVRRSRSFASRFLVGRHSLRGPFLVG